MSNPRKHLKEFLAYNELSVSGVTFIKIKSDKHRVRINTI